MTDHREIISDLTEEEFTLWKHSPITSAFFGFLKDQADNWRSGVSLLIEHGAFDFQSPREDINPHVVRGKILAIDGAEGGLLRISVADMQEFYREERGERSQDDGGSAEPD